MSRHRKLRYCVRVIVIKDDKILLGSTTNSRGTIYKFPGGGVEGKETFEEACKKEVLEEVGVEITEVQSLDYVRLHKHKFLHEATNTVYEESEDHWYTAKYVQDNLSLLNIEGDAMAYHWVSVDEALRKMNRNRNNLFRRYAIAALRIVKERLNDVKHK